MLVLDTNIVIAYFAEEQTVVVALEKALAGGETLVMPTIVQAETMAYQIIDASTLAQMRGWFADTDTAVLDVNTAERAAEIKRATGLKLIDSIIAATTLGLNAKLISRDNDFKKVRELEVIVW